MSIKSSSSFVFRESEQLCSAGRFQVNGDVIPCVQSCLTCDKAEASAKSGVGCQHLYSKQIYSTVVFINLYTKWSSKQPNRAGVDQYFTCCYSGTSAGASFVAEISIVHDSHQHDFLTNEVNIETPRGKTR